jgi:hypothetical protein
MTEYTDAWRFGDDPENIQDETDEDVDIDNEADLDPADYSVDVALVKTYDAHFMGERMNEYYNLKGTP